MIETPVAGADTAAPAAPALDRRRAKRRAAWRRRGLVLAFMSPWLVGFTVFFGYPLVSTVYLSFTHYDLLQPSRWIGLANYDYLFNDDKQIWPAVSNTLWLVVIAVPLKVLFVIWMVVPVVDSELTRAEVGYAGAAAVLCALLYGLYRRGPAQPAAQAPAA